MEHLETKTRTYLDASIVDRVHYTQTVKWIGYPKALQILDQMDELFHHPPSHRMPNMLVASPSNNGKTMIKNQFLNRHNSSDNIDGDHAEIPVLAVQMPATPNPRRFYISILQKLFASYKDSDNLARLETQAITLMKACGVKMLLIDDLHNMLAGRIDSQRQFLNLLRTLGNDLEAPLICFGTQPALRAIQIDDQLANRFLPYILPTWQYGKEFRVLLNSYESLLPLPEKSYLAEAETAQYILTKTEGTIGEAMMLVNKAAIQAIKANKPKIDMPLLNNCGYISPKERRRVAEQRL